MLHTEDELLQDRRAEIKILVVDDREDNLTAVETILEKDKYVVRKATSGRSALKILLQEQDFTLILMDVQMPGMDGFETASLIYESNKLRHIPIIFITAYDYNDEHIFRGYQLGCIDYIYKPINPQLLKAKVDVFVELYQKNHQLIIQEKNLMAINRNLEKEILERRLSQEKVNMLNKQLSSNLLELKATNEELERFAFVASHDLQEPLRKIMLFGGMLAEKHGDTLDPNGREFLEKVIKASERMQTLINNLLVFSRLNNNEADGFETTDLNELLKDVLSDLELFIEQKGALINVTPLPTLKVIPGEIRQLFQNIIINSLKFSQKDIVPEINISYEKSTREIEGIGYASFHDIRIRDNGIGFDQQYADQIFVIFKRLHAYSEYEGTGIGLATCKKIIEKHKGAIAAFSQPGKGAMFTVSFPVHEEGAN